jgi:acyl-coenzyme A thioesterase PaaI-like protein
MATIDMDTHFIDVVRQGDWVVASAKVQRRTRSLVFAAGQLSVGDRTVLAGQAIMKLRTN